MKKKYALATVSLFLCVLLSGCNLWLDGSYNSVKPHLEEYEKPREESVEVNSFAQLQDALALLVEDGSQSGVLYTSDISQDNLDAYMDRAARNIKQHNAIGAYAVDEITYEIGTNIGKQAIAVNISYNHNRSEILRIKQTESMEDAIKVITAALDNCDPGVVLNVKQYSTVDFTQLVQDYVDNNPQTCMEMPQVATTVYPQSGIGTERVVELTFTYQTSRSALRNMQQTVTPVFASAKLYVNTDADNWEKYAQLYSFLMERYDYTIETSITPTYSLLRHGVGDSKAFATVYSAMCRQAGLDCQVVSGTRAGEARCWNLLKIDGVYYHIDLLQCSSSGGFQAYTDEDMTGYVWDYSAYTQ